MTTLDLHIRDLHSLSVSTQNTLLRNGVRSLSDLLEHTPSSLLDLYRVGAGTVQQIVDVLGDAGLALKPEGGNSAGMEVDLDTMRWRYEKAYLRSLVSHVGRACQNDLTDDEVDTILSDFFNEHGRSWGYA